MIYFLPLQLTGLVVGLGLIAAHGMALAKPALCTAWLASFPRSRFWGTTLLTLAAIWSVLLLYFMDLGEFAGLRYQLIFCTVAGAILGWKYMEEFLAVRSLGMLALLAAEPVLSAAFLRHEPTRLLLVLLAYGWIVAGLFWVGMPYLLRDQIQWVTANATRFRWAALAGVGYGVILVAVALAAWR